MNLDMSNCGQITHRGTNKVVAYIHPRIAKLIERKKGIRLDLA